jgi:arsenite-transporting ATPase
MSDGQRLHLFGGKGGAGKTTLAASYALALSEQAAKDAVLLASADPNEALTDLFKKKIGPKPVKLVPGKGEGGLFAVQLDGAQVFQEQLGGLAQALKAGAQKGTVLSADDVGSLLLPSTAAADELAALMWIAETLEAGTYAKAVVDLPATGQAVRLLDLAAQLRRVIALVRGEKPGAKKKDETGPLEDAAQKLERVVAMLKDATKTSFHLVALAEPVSEAQTRGLFTQLRERGVNVSEIVVNQVENKQGCPACLGRRGLQAPHARKFAVLDKAVALQLIGKREAPPRGVDALKKFVKESLGGKENKALEFAASEGPPALVRAPSMPPIAAPPISPTRLIFFVGQGGVGKSSCAAAAAVTLTEKEGPVLLISTDPSHSLSDVLQSRLTDTESQVKGTKGLYARELDIAGWFNAFKKRLREKAEKAFEAQGKAESPDREVLKNLLDSAPAGMDELAALSVLTDAIVQERFKRIVVDPSPARRTLALIELPTLAKGWLNQVHAVVSKYRKQGLGELADDVAGLVKHIQRFEQAIANPAEARFVVVSRGEELAVPKTERLVEALKEKKLAVERVLVNRVLPKSTCPKCENRRKNELTFAKAMEKKVGVPVTMAPALGRHPAGLRELKAFRTSWYALSAPAKIKAA